MFRQMETIPETEMSWLDGMCVDPDATSLPVNPEIRKSNFKSCCDFKKVFLVKLKNKPKKAVICFNFQLNLG
jgi:hypothetical protein